MWSVEGSVVMGLSGLVAGVLIARGLGPENRGLLAAITAPAFLLMTLGMCGLDDSLTRYVANGELRRRSGVRVAVRWSVWAGLAAALASSGLLIFFVVDEALWFEAIAISLLGPVFLLNRLLAGLLNGAGRHRAWNVARASGGVVYAVLVAIAWGLHVLTLPVAVLCWVGCFVAAAVISVALTARAVRPERRDSDRREVGLRDLLRYGWKTAFGKISSQLNQRADQAVMAFLIPAVSLGQYAVAATIALAPGLVITGYSSYALGARSRSGGVRWSDRSLSFSATGWALTILIYLPVIVFAPEIVTVGFGSSYEEAIDLTQLLCVASIFLFGAQTTMSVLGAAGRPGAGAAAQGVALGVTVVGLVLLVPRLGAYGAALTSMAAYFVFAVYISIVAASANRRRNVGTGEDGQ